MEFNTIIRDLKNKVYHPVYLLSGEEEYYIDKISDFIEENVLEEAEREFNQKVLYGLETNVMDLISEAKRYPMIGNYNVVIVKEAQELKKIEELESYLENPSPTTILVLNYKHGKIDKRKKIVKMIVKGGVYFESKRLYENQLPAWIEKYVSDHQKKISPRATQLLVAHLGTDISKVSNELDKLFIGLKEEEEIDTTIIERNIGISKDYNVFELNNALGSKNVVKANEIINYFGKNEKTHNIAALLPMMYRFFSQLLLFHTVSNSSKSIQAATLGINPYFLKDFQSSARNYPVKKIARIMTYLRESDIQSKGVKGGGQSQHDILMELVFKIIH